MAGEEGDDDNNGAERGPQTIITSLLSAIANNNTDNQRIWMRLRRRVNAFLLAESDGGSGDICSDSPLTRNRLLSDIADVIDEDGDDGDGDGKEDEEGECDSDLFSSVLPDLLRCCTRDCQHLFDVCFTRIVWRRVVLIKQLKRPSVLRRSIVIWPEHTTKEKHLHELLLLRGRAWMHYQERIWF